MDSFENHEDDFPSATPRWWYVLWCAWGACICLIVYFFDRDIVSSGLWIGFAGTLAAFSYRPLRRLAIGLFDYYNSNEIESPEYNAEYSNKEPLSLSIQA